MAESYKYFPSGDLLLKKVFPGVKMWAVSLENTMFTYFEIESNSWIESHNHISEQITLVLDGELFFEIDGKTIRVKAGEIIAIPSNIVHAAYTKEKKVKAADAWSPPAEKYINKQK